MEPKASLGILATICRSSSAGGAVVVTQLTFQQPVASGAYAVSNSDLINGLSPSSTDFNSTGTGDPVGSVSRLTNGSNVDRALDQTGFTATYSLDLTASPLGYVITGINTTAGASDNRSRQEYLVYYRLVADDPSTVSVNESTDFVQLLSPGPTTTDRTAGSFQTANSITPGNLFPGGTAGGLAGETKIEISITGLSGVKDVRFISTIPSGNNFDQNTSYKEFDVIGTAVPEPSSFALLVGGLAALLCVRRRNGGPPVLFTPVQLKIPGTWRVRPVGDRAIVCQLP